MVRVLLAMSFVSVATAVQVVETHQPMNYDGMKSTMLSMAKKMEKSGINEGTKVAINGFLDQINGVLIPALNDDKEHAQNALNIALAAVNKCNSDRDDWVASTDKGGFAGANATVHDDQEIHDLCRGQENNTFNNFSHHCDVLESRVCNWHTCPCPDFDNGDSDAVNEYICCLDDFFMEHRESYYAELKNCQQATDLHHEQTRICDGAQATFQNNFCARESLVQRECSEYETCRCNAEREFEDTKKDVEDLEKIFQNQFVALKCLQCYGEEMLKNITDLSGCDDVSQECEAGYPGECPEIVYPTPDDFIDCGEPYENYPCTDAFKMEFYGWISTTQPCTPVDDCDANWCDDDDVATNKYGGGRKGAYADCPVFVTR